MSWDEIKLSYGKAIDAVKADKTPLYIAFILTLLQTLYTYLPDSYELSRTVFTLISIPAAWIGAVWIQMLFDKHYGNTKDITTDSVLRGFGRMVLLILLMAAAIVPTVAAVMGIAWISTLAGLIIGAAVFFAAMYVLTRVLFASQYTVLEGLGPINAVKASWTLTQGKFWKIVGLYATMFGIGIVAMLLVALTALLAGVAVSAFAYLIVYTLLTTIYAGAQVAFFRMVQDKKTQAAQTPAKPVKKKPRKKKK